MPTIRNAYLTKISCYKLLSHSSKILVNYVSKPKHPRCKKERQELKRPVEKDVKSK